jgi:GT2 family glycosyltransferase
VVVLNWNCWEDTLACLASLGNLDYPAFQILVVDNGSKDGSEARIHEAYPDVEILQTGRNLGYAGGNNVGVRRALAGGADYILLINPDVVVEPSMLRSLVDFARSHPRVAALSPVIRHRDETLSVWFGGSHIDWANLQTVHHHQELPPGVFVSSGWSSGCCLLASTAALKRVGLLDERYFLYFEEVDLCQRLIAQGYTVGVWSDAVAFHQPHGSVEQNSMRYQYYMIRNSFLFFTRYAPWHGTPRLRTLKILYRRFLLNRRAVRKLLKRDPATVARFWACLDSALGRYGASHVYR